MYNKEENITIPKNLNSVVESSILQGRYRRKLKLYRKKIALLLITVFVFTFILPLNFNQSFADVALDTPGLKILARIFTFRNYQELDNRYYKLDVKYPNIKMNVSNSSDLHTNVEINRIIEEEIEKSKERAFEYYTAFVETGGRAEDFPGVDIHVDYDIKCDNKDYLSFIIYKSENLGSAYTKMYVYNIDSQTGENISIDKFLGPHYKNLIVQNINEEISKWTEEKNMLLFEEVDIRDYVNENMKYYINKEGKAVVIFDKYTIACGAAGVLEFEISID